MKLPGWSWFTSASQMQAVNPLPSDRQVFFAALPVMAQVQLSICRGVHTIAAPPPPPPQPAAISASIPNVVMMGLDKEGSP